MMVKGIIGILLLVGVLQVIALEKKGKSFEFRGESPDLVKSEGGSSEEKKNFELNNDFNKKVNKNYKKESKYAFEKELKNEGQKQNEKYMKDYKKESKYYNDKNYYKYGKYNKDLKKNYKKNGKPQFEKDYGQWKKQMKYEQINENYEQKFPKENEVESQEFIDKYNKYGKTFNPNFVDSNYKKKKEVYQGKKIEKLDKSKSLEGDTDVNYLNGNKKINENSELINENLETSKSKENYQENFQNKDEVYSKRSKKFFENFRSAKMSPPFNDEIKLARYIVHVVDWASVATLTSRNNHSTLDPFVCVKAMSDGEVDKSTGVPMFYMSQLDLCADDLKKNDQVSLLMSLAQTDYCKTKSYDPQDPRCAKVMMSGKMKWLEPNSEEAKLAETALFSRHPIMKRWPKDHNWMFAKMDMSEVLLLYRFGGSSSLNLNNYLQASFNLNSTSNDNQIVEMP